MPYDQLNDSRDNSRVNNSVNYGQAPPPKSSNDQFLSGAGGRALLHDLDTKFNEQDRMLKYLMVQIQSIEDGQSTMKDQQYKVRDGDIQTISNIESQMKFEQEQNRFAQQEMFGKIKNLEEQVNLAEQARNEMRDKLRVAEDGNREMITFIKNL